MITLEAQYAADLKTVFRRRPLVVGFSSELVRDGDFFTRDLAALPLLFSRGRDGELHAYVNVCKHRGARLVMEACGRDRRAFVCPLHGWVYDIDGNLRASGGVDGALGDKTKLALTSVPSAEAFGLVWSLLTPKAVVDVRAALDPAVVTALDALDLPARKVRGARVEPRDVSWQRALEAVIDRAAGPVHVVAPNALVVPRDGRALVVFVTPTGVDACKVTTAALVEDDADPAVIDAEITALSTPGDAAPRGETPVIDTFRAAIAAARAPGDPTS